MVMNRNKVKEVLLNLRNISAECDGLFLDEIKQLEDMLEQEKYKVVVIGEFSTGKSTFLNALVGRETLFSSLREATGVVTYVENGHEQMATLYFENGDKKSFLLQEEEDFKQLSTYIDRKSKEKKPSYVSITTPGLKFDEEVAFIDTPGLRGLQEKDLLMTKNAIKEANATIVLTTEKGFSGSELEIISGKHPKFGKIRTKDIFVVINQIGKVYEGKSEDAGDKKVTGIINEVKGGLEREGLSSIPVFAIDSRDYLWSQDDSLYQKIRQNNENKTTTIQSQDYYLKRSRFEAFKRHLLSFLSTDQRNQNFIEDITEKISYIIEAFEEAFSEQKMVDQVQKNKQLEILKGQQQLLVENRRKLYNSLVRAISQSIDTYKDKVEEDLKNSLQEEQKNVVPLINEQFPTKDSLTQKNMTVLNQKVSETIREKRGAIEQQLSDYYNTLLTYLIHKTWTEAFQRMFKEQTNVTFKLKSAQVKLDLKWKDVTYDDEEKVIQELLEQQRQIEKAIEKLKAKKGQLEREIAVTNERKLDKKKAGIEADYLKEKNKLGKRPEPKQKYRTEERTKRKFLIFKETYYVEVPDGLDYTLCQQWDKQQEQLKKRYLKDMDLINQEIAEYEETKLDLVKTNREIEYKQASLEEVQEDIIEQQHYLLKKKEQHEKFFLNEKKMEIVKSFRKVMKDLYNHMLEQVFANLYRLEVNMKDELKQEINQAIQLFELELQQKITEIAEQIQVSNHHLDYIFTTLTKIKGEMVHELR